MLSLNELRHWTNLNEWSDAAVADFIVIDLHLIPNAYDVERLFAALIPQCPFLRIQLVSQSLNATHFLTHAFQCLTPVLARLEYLGVEVFFMPVIFEEFLEQLIPFSLFQLRMIDAALQMTMLKHLQLDIYATYIVLPNLIGHFAYILNSLPNPELLQSLKLHLKTAQRAMDSNLRKNYYDDYQWFFKGLVRFKHLKHIDLSFFPLDRVLSEQRYFTHPETQDVCFIEENIAKWIGQHSALQSVSWNMFYFGFCNLRSLVHILENRQLQMLICVINNPRVAVGMQSMLEHQTQVLEVGRLLKFHPSLKKLRLCLELNKIHCAEVSDGFEHINQQNQKSFIMGKLIRPLSQNRFIENLHLDLGEAYENIELLFAENYTLNHCHLAYIKNEQRLSKRIAENRLGYQALMRHLLTHEWLNLNNTPLQRSQMALEMISPREIHRVDHLLWVFAMPAFIYLQHQTAVILDTLPIHSNELVHILISHFLGDLFMSRLHIEPFVCFKISMYLDYMVDIYQLMLAQGGILRRGLRPFS